MTPEMIKQWCKAHSMSQADLARAIGYSHGALNQALNGARVLQPRMMEAIKRIMEEEASKHSAAHTIAPITETELQQAAAAIGKTPQELSASILHRQALLVASETSTKPAN